MEDPIVPEITIPLGRLPASKLGRKEDYFKIIHDTYTTRYLEALGVGVTAKNRLAVARNAPLIDCEIEAAWGDHAAAERSAIAEQLRVVQPKIVAKEPAEQEVTRPLGMDADDVGSPLLREHFRYVGVVPPDMPDVFGAPKAREGVNAADLTDAALSYMKLHDAAASHGNDAALTEELDRLRSRHRNTDGIDHSILDDDLRKQEHRLRMVQELQVLKPQFLLPFACVRPAAAGSGAESSVLPWQSPEFIAHPEADVPEDLRTEALEPIIATEADIRKAASSFAEHRCPLELLTVRRDPDFLASVRKQMPSDEVVRITGLMAHLLYWLLFQHLHHPAQRLPQSSHQSLLVTIHDRWAALVATCTSLPSGVGFVLPILALTIKRGVRDVFAARYPRLCTPGAPLIQHLIDRINVLFMQLFDPDCTYARFGMLDQTREAAQLWRKLDLAMTGMGRGTATRMATRKNRTTPVLHALMGLEGSRPGNAKTRRLLSSSASDPALSRSNPPSARPRMEAWSQESIPRRERSRPPSAGKRMESWKQAALYKVACQRMTSSGREALSRASSAREIERPERLHEELHTRPAVVSFVRARSSIGGLDPQQQCNEVPAQSRPPRMPSASRRSASLNSKRNRSLSAQPRPVSAKERAR
mmetsp:Transcript_118730/g.221952  ORF Transcript_118730/g.221952 Transcript_118730/m.221952 type:complete len:645 (+) Transcript_118730:90-2024(+)